MYFFYFRTWNKHFNQSLFFPLITYIPLSGCFPMWMTRSWTTPCPGSLSSTCDPVDHYRTSCHISGSRAESPVAKTKLTTFSLTSLSASFSWWVHNTRQDGLKERFMYDTDTATIPKSASKVWPISDQYLTNGSSLPWHELYTSRFKVQSKSTSHRNNSVLQFLFFLVGTFTWKSSLGTKKVVSAKNPALIYPPVTDLQGEVEQNSVKPQNSSRTYFSRFICCRISLP